MDTLAPTLLDNPDCGAVAVDVDVTESRDLRSRVGVQAFHGPLLGAVTVELRARVEWPRNSKRGMRR